MSKQSPFGRIGGPLAGVRVVELSGIGPGPFATMLLADMGADVIRIDRPGPPAYELNGRFDLLRRSRPVVRVDLRDPDGRASVYDLIEKADVVIEGSRPGVTERLGLGPDDCMARNPRLVYGRMTGWGQQGPAAHTAGHDITYIAVSGALHAIGEAGGPPIPPVNFVGDFGGGSLYLAMGILAALLEARQSGKGQVVDAAIAGGAASLTTLLHGFMASGGWVDERGVNQLDGGAPYYSTYETSDGKWVAVGAIEPKFWREFCRLLPLDSDLEEQQDPARWPALRERIAARFKTKTRQEWTDLFFDTDACVAPVLSLTESPNHPQMQERSYTEVDGIVQPAPHPRFSRTASLIRQPPPADPVTTESIAAEWEQTPGTAPDETAKPGANA